MKTYNYISVIAVTILMMSCKNENKTAVAVAEDTTEKTATTSPPVQPLSQAFKDYWYAGEAEITSYKLEQARYGELREGTAVMVYVTEPFDADQQVKADYDKASNIPVLKLNATKNFNTGIYPYSIMQSTFYPVGNNQHALKVSASIQEWCGQVYSQINNRDALEFMSHSYFQSEGDQNTTLSKAILENELWTQLRIDPKSLPTGNIEVIPALEFIRLMHIEAKPYKAIATLTDGQYMLNYAGLNRELRISFSPAFPYNIEGWTESYQSGFGANARVLQSTATKLTRLKSAYWSKNSNADADLRQQLQLD